jgi:transposase
MSGTMTWVGLDVHARSTHAAAIDTLTGELSRVRFGPGIDGPVAWLAELPGPVRACYEAGPTGFGLYRAAVAAGIGMQVIAPGKTPRGPSDRVKTDRKDAELLARLLLAGSLTRVVVPPPEVEAAREMTRAHDACRRDLMNARHRVSKMLLRHGRVYPKSTTWTAEHRRWLSKQQFDEPASSLVFADLVAAVDGLTSRKTAIALRLSELATDERWWPIVARLRAFRGIDTLTAFSLHLELGADWKRFESAPALSAWLGLTPSLNQSGESSRQGSITKTGSMLARRLLVESAWHYSRQPRLGATLANRQAGQPAHILAISNRAQQRLHNVNRSMRARGKPHNVTVVACARQLACFLWAAATADRPQLDSLTGRWAGAPGHQRPARAIQL